MRRLQKTRGREWKGQRAWVILERWRPLLRWLWTAAGDGDYGEEGTDNGDVVDYFDVKSDFQLLHQQYQQ